MDILITPIDNEENKRSNPIHSGELWRSCSGCLCDKNLLVFSSQLTISVTIIVFALYQLSVSRTCERDSLYAGIVSLILGCWLPSPVSTRSK
jgi:hypothetical protein